MELNNEIDLTNAKALKYDLYDTGRDYDKEDSVAVIKNSYGEKVADIVTKSKYKSVEAVPGKLNRIEENYLRSVYCGDRRYKGHDFGCLMEGIEFMSDENGCIEDVKDLGYNEEPLYVYSSLDVMDALKYEYYHNKNQPNVSEKVFFNILSKTNSDWFEELTQKFNEMFNETSGYKAIESLRDGLFVVRNLFADDNKEVVKNEAGEKVANIIRQQNSVVVEMIGEYADCAELRDYLVEKFQPKKTKNSVVVARQPKKSIVSRVMGMFKNKTK